jgi:two-component system nitrate/nitrite response regulator NarL
MTRLVLADNHAVFLDAIGEVLSHRGFTVAAAVTDITALVPALRAEQPDMCLLDRHFGSADGLDAIGAMRAAAPHTRIIVLSADRDGNGVLRALRAGAAGYLHKAHTVAVLIAAIERVMAGEIVTELPDRERAQDWPDDAHRLAAHLTAREWECLAMLVDGMDTTGIAAALSVSRTTVRTHVQALMAKLGVHSRLEAASYAMRYRLLDDMPAAPRAAPAM